MIILKFSHKDFKLDLGTVTIINRRRRKLRLSYEYKYYKIQFIPY